VHDGQGREHEIQVMVDRERAARLGLSPQAVAQTIAVAMRGDPLKEFRADDREIQMRLAFRADNRQTLEDLAATPLYLPDGTRSSLGAVANFRIDQTARTIDRVDRLRPSSSRASSRRRPRSTTSRRASRRS
jgi:HAE1 family hydrophobic/amphiphilic exporter-1